MSASDDNKKTDSSDLIDFSTNDAGSPELEKTHNTSEETIVQAQENTNDEKYPEKSESIHNGDPPNKHTKKIDPQKPVDNRLTRRRRSNTSEMPKTEVDDDKLELLKNIDKIMKRFDDLLTSREYLKLKAVSDKINKAYYNSWRDEANLLFRKIVTFEHRRRRVVDK
ncbi:MAG: hypothetical protein HQK54_00315 [Oligoflexales bacterium]|nr:hypothetical protein [Oligoflexales bacterium]